MKFCPEKVQGKIQINTSDFSRGSYLVTLDFSAGSICRKLIVL
jgi:hypothetical protein